MEALVKEIHTKSFSWRKWIARLYVAIGTAVVMSAWMMNALGSPQIGWDFPVFYIAAHVPVQSLYDPNVFSQFWQDYLKPIGVPHWAPYVRPPIFSLPLHVLLNLPYYEALTFWVVGGIVMFLTSVLLLLHKFKLPAFLAAACVAYFPGAAGILSGADVSIYLLMLVVALLFLERGWDRSAGAALAICLCKFNLVLLIPLMLVSKKRYQALAVFLFGAVLVVLGSLGVSDWHAYLNAVADAPRIAGGFFPVGLRGFSNAVGLPWIYAPLAISALIICCWLCYSLPLRESLSAALVGALLISPYVTWYDSTLLILPLLLVYSRSTTSTMRVACLSVILAVPLWEHGGGNNGPIGFMHVGVEFSLLVYFVRIALRPRYCEAKRNPLERSAFRNSQDT